MSAVTWPSEWPANATGASIELADRLPRHQRREQHRELRLACAGEHLGGRVEHELGERLAERGLGLVDHRPRSVVTPGRAHTRLLGPLAGEDDRDGQARGLSGRRANLGFGPRPCGLGYMTHR